MARIPRIDEFNLSGGIENLRIKKTNGDTIILTVEEARESIRNLMVDEIGLIANELSVEVRERVKLAIDAKLEGFQEAMLKHINDKITKITERLVEETLNRTIRERVNTKIEGIHIDEFDKNTTE
jgi:hypothetical protein